MKTTLSDRLLYLVIFASLGLSTYIAFINPGLLRFSSAPRGPAPVPRESVSVGQNASFAPAQDTRITLNGTKGKTFELTGEVWLDGPSATARFPAEAADGFAVFVRQVDGLHRYEMNTNFVRDKRRLLNGQPEGTIVRQNTFPKIARHVWVPFSVNAGQDQITFQIGPNTATVAGPLDTTGDNEIDLIAGSKLQNVRLQILGDAR